MIKRKFLRYLATYKAKRYQKALSRLSEEQRLVFNIAMKLLAASTSVLETSTIDNVLYVKNDLKLIKIDMGSIHFVNGKYSYYFTYEHFLMQELREVYHRHKEMSIKHLIEEISIETTGHLKKIFVELNTKEL